MSFSQHCKWIFVLYLFCCPFLVAAQQQKETPISVSLQVKPNKCVALNQGRECFTTVAIDWGLPALANVCVSIQYVEGEMLTLECWDEKASGQIEYEFQSANNATLFLIRKSDNFPLASTLIQVSWLYQVNVRKRRWRLF